MKCCLTVPLTCYRTKCCPCVLILSTKSDECADEEKAEVLDKLEREMKLLQSDASQMNKQFVLSREIKTILGEELRPVFHRV